MVRRALLPALTLLLATGALAQARPTLTAEPGGTVTARLPLQVLQNRHVRKQLDSGLTTTFVLTVRDGRQNGAARLEVRWDLWDEVWIVRTIDVRGVVDRQRLAGSEAFERWWRKPLHVMATKVSRPTLQVELNVLPFSAAEEEDARQWISKSGGVTTAGAGTGIIDALIGTTLSAKPITTFRWDVGVSAR